MPDPMVPSIDRSGARARLAMGLGVAYVLLAAAEFVPAHEATHRPDDSTAALLVGALCLVTGALLFVRRARAVVRVMAALLPVGFLLYGALGAGWSRQSSCGCLGGRLTEAPAIRLAIAAALLAGGLVLVWEDEDGPPAVA